MLGGYLSTRYKIASQGNKALAKGDVSLLRADGIDYGIACLEVPCKLAAQHGFQFHIKLYKVLQLCQWHLVLASVYAVTFMPKRIPAPNQMSYTRTVEPRAQPP